MGGRGATLACAAMLTACQALLDVAGPESTLDDAAHDGAFERDIPSDAIAEAAPPDVNDSKAKDGGAHCNSPPSGLVICDDFDDPSGVLDWLSPPVTPLALSGSRDLEKALFISAPAAMHVRLDAVTVAQTEVFTLEHAISVTMTNDFAFSFNMRRRGTAAEYLRFFTLWFNSTRTVGVALGFQSDGTLVLSQIGPSPNTSPLAPVPVDAWLSITFTVVGGTITFSVRDSFTSANVLTATVGETVDLVGQTATVAAFGIETTAPHPELDFVYDDFWVRKL
jgi:hypothetical protein